MSFVAAAIGGSALLGAYSASKSAEAQTNAANNDLALQREIYDDTSQKFQPYLESGNNALAGYNYELGMGERPEGYGGFQQTPGYQFGLQQGMDAVEARGAVNGGVNSGSTLTALNRFGQDYATGEYNNYLNRLGGLMSSGQNAAGQQAAAGQNYAQGAGNAYANIGNAQAAGIIGVNNALQGGIQNGISLYQYQQGLK